MRLMRNDNRQKSQNFTSQTGSELDKKKIKS